MSERFEIEVELTRDEALEAVEQAGIAMPRGGGALGGPESWLEPWPMPCPEPIGAAPPRPPSICMSRARISVL